MSNSITLNNSIFFSDLDGTLLNNNAQLSANARKKLADLIDNGMLFSIASARNLHSVNGMLNQLPLSLPVVTLNGAYISDIKTLKHIQINDIETAVKEELGAFIVKNKMGVFISNHVNNEDGIVYYQLKNEGEFWYLNDRKNTPNQKLQEASTLNAVLSSQITCFTFIGRKENLLDLNVWLKNQFPGKLELHLFENQYSKGWFWLTAHSALATKSRAIQYIINEFNLVGKHVTVFGDGINDLNMFELADTAIAVDNAIDTVKAKANLVIGSNEQDSVVHFLAGLK